MYPKITRRSRYNEIALYLVGKHRSSETMITVHYLESQFPDINLKEISKKVNLYYLDVHAVNIPALNAIVLHDVPKYKNKSIWDVAKENFEEVK